jgi:hypothetical protein
MNATMRSIWASSIGRPGCVAAPRPAAAARNGVGSDRMTISAATTPGRKTAGSTEGDALAHSLVADPGAIAVELRVGAHYFCLEFGGESRVRSPRRIVAVDAPAPGRCPTAAP